MAERAETGYGVPDKTVRMKPSLRHLEATGATMCDGVVIRQRHVAEGFLAQVFDVAAGV